MANEMSKAGSRLARFRLAQDDPQSGYQRALDEIRSGRKLGHWIWYVFPQISGLGLSDISREFAIDGEDEAMDFLRDEELRSRLLTITQALAQRITGSKGVSLRTIMGSDVDARKVVSSLTLFGHAVKALRETENAATYLPIAAVADEVLKVAQSQGYPPCEYTLRRLRCDPANGA
jgi:uncharacterized protein (DUF1810 family)